jgi:hypothetical protein
LTVIGGGGGPRSSTPLRCRADGLPMRTISSAPPRSQAMPAERLAPAAYRWGSPGSPGRCQRLEHPEDLGRLAGQLLARDRGSDDADAPVQARCDESQKREVWPDAGEPQRGPLRRTAQYVCRATVRGPGWHYGHDGLAAGANRSGLTPGRPVLALGGYLSGKSGSSEAADVLSTTS